MASRGAALAADPSVRRATEMRRSLMMVAVGATMLGGCGPGEIFVTRTGDVTARIVTFDNRMGVPCSVTHTSFGDEEADKPTLTSSGQEVTRRVAFVTQLRLPAPFKPRVALVARCTGYQPSTSAETEVDVAWLATPRTQLGTIVALSQ